MTDTPYFCVTCGWVELDGHLRCGLCGSDQIIVHAAMAGGTGLPKVSISNENGESQCPRTN